MEAAITALVKDILETTRDLFKPGETRALLLIGGYGRGEGGVVVAEGKGRPHNNLDFLLVTDSLSEAARNALLAQFRERVAPLIKQYGVEIEISGNSARSLRHAPSLVMWYDMRDGHKTIWGDAAFVPSLNHLSAGRIPAWDIRNLIVNRGSAVVANDQFIAKGILDRDARRLIVKQAMKGIIGYGDALLFLRGAYHWSYAEKQRRMKQSQDIAPEFRALYDEAVEFRFLPDYARYVNEDLGAWMARLWRELEPIHRACEAKRVGVKDLAWSQYAEAALAKEVFAEARSLRAWAKKGLNLVRSPRYPGPASAMARMGFRMLARRQWFFLLQPVVAYDIQDTALRDAAANLLRCGDTTIDELRRGYLRLWHEVGDPGFGYILRQWPGLLEPGERTA